jgi:hypothetical protein
MAIKFTFCMMFENACIARVNAIKCNMIKLYNSVVCVQSIMLLVLARPLMWTCIEIYFNKKAMFGLKKLY